MADNQLSTVPLFPGEKTGKRNPLPQLHKVMVKKEEDTSDPRNYDVLYQLDLEQLRFFAAQYKVKGCQTMSKSEIVAAIKELSRIRDEQYRKSKRSRRK